MSLLGSTIVLHQYEVWKDKISASATGLEAGRWSAATVAKRGITALGLSPICLV